MRFTTAHRGRDRLERAGKSTAIKVAAGLLPVWLADLRMHPEKHLKITALAGNRRRRVRPNCNAPAFTIVRLSPANIRELPTRG